MLVRYGNNGSEGTKERIIEDNSLQSDASGMENFGER